MRRSPSNNAFALAVTLMLMTLVVIVIVAYLANTRTDRATSSVYANKLRAQVMAESGLAAATQLLRDNTRYGNYITAMPAPSPAPASIYTEIYRPTNRTDTTSAISNDYLTFSNAAGELLVSLAASPTPIPTATPFSVDPRPSPSMVYVSPTPTPLPVFVLPSPVPALAEEKFPPSVSPTPVGNSYNFNQIVRLGTNASGRLVQPSPSPSPPAALGQWIRVRNANNELIGRYAFFVEDESMKVNVNVTGNNLGPPLSPNLRVNDLIVTPASPSPTPTPSPTPASQVQEVDPAGILSASADRAAADTALAGVSVAGSRLASRSTVALLDQWNANFSDYAHLATVVSRDDDTTAKGWKRMDLNALVAPTTDNASKVAAASRIANWIRDAWTGPTAIGNLQDYQMYGDDWARKQIAANIVDYIDSDSTPTDMGDIIPANYVLPVAVIGLEKAPYLAAVEIIFQASNTTYPGTGTGTFNATLKMKIQLRFFNMFDTTLDLTDIMGNTSRSRIEITGVPIIQKNGTTVYDLSGQTWTVKVSDLTPVNGTGTTVPAGTDGQTTSGARTFQTDWLDTQTNKSFTVASSDQNPRFTAGSLRVKTIGNRTNNVADDYRIDDTSIVTNSVKTGYYRGSSGSAGDFLKDSTTAHGPLQIASINYIAGYQGALFVGSSSWDPRYRGRLTTDRWTNDGRTDATYPCSWITPAPTQDRITAFIDTAEVNPRAYGFDWFDAASDRPLAFIRNGPMLNVGELGNIAACEYPWRTIYLQYPERVPNTTSAGPVTDIPQRRGASLDYVLVDLFATQTVQPRFGAININTQQRFGTQQHSFNPLFLSELIGAQPALTQTMIDRICDSTGSATINPIFNRRVAVNAPLDNSPARPFFEIGDLASPLSRLVNSSTRVSGESRSTVTYSILRNTPSLTTEVNPNYRSDMLAEQEFREISNSITTRGNVFRVLYVGQSVKDVNANGAVDANEVQSEYLGEAFIERQGAFVQEGTLPDTHMKTSDSSYKVISNRVITQ